MAYTELIHSFTLQKIINFGNLSTRDASSKRIFQRRSESRTSVLRSIFRRFHDVAHRIASTRLSFVK